LTAAVAVTLAPAGRCPAQDSNSAAAAILRRYEVEPDAAGVLSVLRRWQPSAENRARIARLVAELGDENFAVRDAASHQLAAMGTLAESALREATQCRDAEVVFRARKLLAECRQGRGPELLSAALKWLRQSPDPQATPLLLELLPVLPETFQSSAREALWICAGPDDVLRLRKAIRDARPAVRSAAIPALERAAGAEAVAELAPLLGDKKEEARLAAARALLDRRPRPSIAALVNLLDAQNPSVVQQSAWLLEQLSGIPRAADPPAEFAATVVQWKAWAATDAAGHPQPLGIKRLRAIGYAQPPFVPGVLGNAVTFNGTVNYIDFGNPTDNHLDIGANATIEAWVRFDALPSSSPATFVGKNEGPFNRNKWVFAYAYRYGGVANATVFHINSPATGPIWLHSKPWTPVIGQWYHLAVVKSRNQYTFYRNGEEDGTDSTTALVPHVNYNLLMGHSENDFRLHGALDDVRIWKTNIAGDQIHARMNAELTGGEPGLVGYWTMNGSSGTTVTDSSSYGVNGTYNGRVGGGQ
jgi:HEAT repeat protein